jgi:putative NIF3 family GTP cyclohydrolase 1 type 2
MKAKILYDRLENDFISSELSDIWAKYMVPVYDFLTENFKIRSMGLVCDFAKEITKAYSAVFPTDKILQQIIDSGTTDAMLFLHHPSIWDIRTTPTFKQMNPVLVKKLQEHRISIYNLHVPLDNYSDYSTSKTLADALDIEVVKPFAQYRGGLAGVIGKTKCKTVEELNTDFAKAVGYSIKLYLYGDSVIDGNVGIIAGGGNIMETVTELLDNNVKVLISGITVNNDISSEVHRCEKANRINVLGGTHYSTEKFACIKMCSYFESLGLESEFMHGEPILEDM